MVRKRLVIICTCILLVMLCSCDKKENENNGSNKQEIVDLNTDDGQLNDEQSEGENQQKEQVQELQTNDGKDTNTVQENKDGMITKEMQLILDNNEFLSSFEGTQFKIKAYQFSKVFFNGDYTYIKDNIVNESKLDEYDYKNQFDDIECMYFTFENYDKESNIASGVYAVQLTKDSGFIYLCFKMILVDDSWKIVDYIIDA